MFKLLVYILIKYACRYLNIFLFFLFNMNNLLNITALKLTNFITIKLPHLFIKINRSLFFNIKSLSFYKFFFKLKILSIFFKLLKLLSYSVVNCFVYLYDIVQYFLFFYIFSFIFFSTIFKYIYSFLFFVAFNFITIFIFLFECLYFCILNITKKSYLFNLFLNLKIFKKYIKERIKEYVKNCTQRYVKKYTKEYFKTWFILIEAKFFKSFKSTKQYLYWFFYQALFYDFILEIILQWSYVSHSKRGLNFSSKEEIMSTYYSYLTDIERFIYKYIIIDLYKAKYHTIEFYYFYERFVKILFVWWTKKFLFRNLLYIYIILKKSFVSSFLLFFMFLLLIAFAKYLFIIVFLNTLKLRLFSVPLYVIFNYYFKVCYRIKNFFRSFQLRMFRYSKLIWIFFPSKAFRYFRQCGFYFTYKRNFRRMGIRYYSIYDTWVNFLTDNFVCKFFSRRYNRRYKRYKRYKQAIKFKHKFGVGNYGIIKFGFKKVFLIPIWLISKSTYVLVWFFSLIAHKLVYILKKIFGSGKE